MKKVKVGIISYEHMHALSYTRALSIMPEAVIAGIADDDEFRGTEMAGRFKTKYYRDYRELIKSDIDGVIICTNNRLHTQTAIDSANAGKHIMVEKPFAVNHEHAKSMLDACRDNNVRIMTAFPLRFNQASIEVKKSLDAGDIGQILCITGINHGKIPSGWFLNKNLAGGGAVMDHSVHIADLIRWFTGSEIKNVYAESGSLIHNAGIDDCGILNIKLENGVFATIDTSWAHHKNYPIWPEVYLEIVGTEGVIVLDAFKQTERVFSACDNKITDEIWGSDGDLGLVREFVDVLMTGREPKVTGLDGARAMEAAVAAYRSSESHKVEEVIHI